MKQVVIIWTIAVLMSFGLFALAAQSTAETQRNVASIILGGR